MGMEGAGLQAVVLWQAAGGINACDLAASLFLEEKGKNRKTRNSYLYAPKIFLNRPLCIGKIIHIVHAAHKQSTSVTCHSTTSGQSRCFVQGLRATKLNTGRTGRTYKSFFKYSETLSFCQLVCHKFICSQHLWRRWELNCVAQFNTIYLKAV